MIVVDTSVWVDFFRRNDTEGVRKLREIGQRTPLLVGDLILLEVLQGARDDAHAQRIKRELLRLDVVSMLGPDLATAAAARYRRLRSLGITIRKLADLVIGSYCIERGYSLLHADRDFEPMHMHLGLLVV